MLRLRRAKLACHFILMLLMLNASAFAQTLTFAADEWCPVNCEPGSERPGYMVEIASRILEPLGYEVRYQQITWARALLFARQGRFDGVFAGTPEEATGFVFPSEAQGRYTIGMFVAKDDPWRYDGPSSLKDKRAGLIIDYGYGEEIEASVNRYSEVVRTGGNNALEQNIRTLAAGRLDYMLEDINTFSYKAEEMGLADRFRLEKTFTQDDLFIALTPAHANSHEIAKALSEGMHRLRNSGELSQILQRYGLRDWIVPTSQGHSSKVPN